MLLRFSDVGVRHIKSVTSSCRSISVYSSFVQSLLAFYSVSSVGSKISYNSLHTAHCFRSSSYTSTLYSNSGACEMYTLKTISAVENKFFLCLNAKTFDGHVNNVGLFIIFSWSFILPHSTVFKNATIATNVYFGDNWTAQTQDLVVLNWCLMNILLWLELLYFSQGHGSCKPSIIQKTLYGYLFLEKHIHALTHTSRNY